MKKRRWIGVIAIVGMMMSGLVACDSDEPEVPTDPQEPETPVTPQEPETPAEIEPLPEEVRPVLTDGKRWVVEFARFDNNLPDVDNKRGIAYDTVSYEVKCDTLIDGIESKIIESNEWVHYIGQRASYCERDGKVYVYWGDDDHTIGLENGWGMLYDFNATEPATMPYTNSIAFIPISRGTVTVANKVRRALKVENKMRGKDLFPYDYWVEGVGSICCYMIDYRTVFPSCVYFRYMRILECYENGEKIFDADEFDESSYTPLEVFGE